MPKERFLVRLASGSSFHQDADYFRTDGGCLCFFNYVPDTVPTRQVVRVLAPGVWLEIERLERA